MFTVVPVANWLPELPPVINETDCTPQLSVNTGDGKEKIELQEPKIVSFGPLTNVGGMLSTTVTW